MKENTLRGISVVLLLGLFIWLIWALKELVLLLILGYGIAYVLHPFLTFFEKRGISRAFSFFILAVVICLVGVIFLAAVIPPIIYQVKLLLADLPSYFSYLKEAVPKGVERIVGYLPKEVVSKERAIGFAKDWLPTVTPATLSAVGSALIGGLLKGYSLTLTIFNLFILPFIVYYFAVDFRGMHLELLKLVPVRRREGVREVVLEIDGVLRSYMKGQLVVASILAVMYGVGLWLVGVNFWFILALISGFGNVVPYLGFITGIVLSSLVALVSSGGVWTMLWVWVVYAVVQSIEGNFLTPKIVGSSVGLSPLAVLLSIIAGGMLFGIIGVLVAVPLAGAAKVLFRRWREWMVEASTS
ncbi:MAG: AI-2E family transporter [Candidatus Dadabacteria bacterium]|nr:MAG: AI-2E family transporter [Candidatus Dadabacteria bacterium]